MGAATVEIQILGSQRDSVKIIKGTRMEFNL
jgi:hypothetical protein